MGIQAACSMPGQNGLVVMSMAVDINRPGFKSQLIFLVRIDRIKDKVHSQCSARRLAKSKYSVNLAIVTGAPHS